MTGEFHDVIELFDDEGNTYISGWCDEHEIRKAVKEDGYQQDFDIADIRHVFMRSVPQFEESADGCKWPILTFYSAVPHTRGARKITICRLETK